MQYGFKAHAVRHEPIVLQLLEETLKVLNWVCNFTLRALEDVNRLITDSKSRLWTRLLSIAMRDKALRRSSDIVVRISFFTRDNTEKDRSPLQL